MGSSNIPRDWSTLSKLNPEFEKLLSAMPPSTIEWFKGVTIDSIRAIRQGRGPSAKWPGIAEKEIYIPARDGFKNRAIVFSPESNEGNGPLLIMIHGGGFCVGNAEQEEGNCRKWVKSHEGVAVSIEHRLAPEAKFPVPVEDAFDSLKWIAENAKSLGANPAKGLLLGGVSSGATCAMVASHLYRDEKISPPLTGIYLSICSPCVPTALPGEYKSDPRITSWEQNANAPLFGSAARDIYRNAYRAPADSPLRSPLLWPTGHAGLPPTYFQIAGADQSRDYALLFDEILREQGVKTKVDVFPGLPHGFWAMMPQAEFSKDFHAKTEAGLEWLLGSGRLRTS